MEKDKKINLFLDSGAYSAYTQKINIDIYEYIKFIKENEDIITVYANLDVIGSATKTWQNQMIMEKEGLRPLAVFHVEDDIRYLYKYIEKYNHFCIGGMALSPKEQRILFLDRCFSIICDTSDNLPKVKIHGFGMTSFDLLFRYPWYSVDSTSWVVTGRMGSIYIPRYRNGQWIYDENSWKISVSNKSPDMKDAGAHISTMSPVEQRMILQYIHDKGYKLGKSEWKKEAQDYELKEDEKWGEKKPLSKSDKRLVEIIVEEGVSNKYQLRDEMNIIYFLDLEKSMKPWPWAFKNPNTIQSLF